LLRHRRKDARSFPAELRFHPLPFSHCSCLTLVRVRDVTAEQEAEVKKQQEARLFQLALQKAWVQTIEVLAAASEAKDPYTSGHQKRVANLAVAIAKELKLTDDQITGLRMAALIHDIGKLSLSAGILSKPVAFSPLERQMVELHAQAGYDLLKSLDLPWNVADVVHQHHERADGSGYPAHLSGDETLFKAKILCVADVVEAMSSHRPYRPSLGLQAALNEIKQGRSRLYDSEVVDACLNLFQDTNFTFA
jgi:putative nucleotidyltransferase with HDIG domain